MNKYAKIFVAVVAFAFLSDVITFGIMALFKGMGGEANPIKVIFGDDAIFIAIGLSFVFACFLYFLITRAETKFRKGLVAIVVANIVYAKVVASVANLLVVLSSGPVETYSSGDLLVGYFFMMIFILVSPVVFNLLFYWIWWNWFKEVKKGE